MGVPASQMWAVVRHILRCRLRGEQRYSLVLMLEPLVRCNLACAGCGKIQYPPDILKKHLSPQECFRAVEECGAPIVSVAGGEPLLHPQIHEIIRGLVARKKYVYLCTNALLLEKHLHRFTPSKHLAFSVHLDGPREEHDRSVCREGVFDIAVRAIQTALDRGFRVTTNTTVFNDADPEKYRRFFDFLMDLGVEGITISPGFPYEKAPDQDRFLQASETIRLFQRLLQAPNRRWRFNQSALFLEFLQGRWPLQCTPWGNPTYTIFGWQRPCYLLQEGYASSYRELLEDTDWTLYGPASGNPRCAHCRMHCGFEPTAVAQTFTPRGLWATLALSLGRFGVPLPVFRPKEQQLAAVSAPPTDFVRSSASPHSAVGTAACNAQPPTTSRSSN